MSKLYNNLMKLADQIFEYGGLEKTINEFNIREVIEIRNHLNDAFQDQTSLDKRVILETIDLCEKRISEERDDKIDEIINE